jgi:hypothetical protein
MPRCVGVVTYSGWYSKNKSERKVRGEGTQTASPFLFLKKTVEKKSSRKCVDELEEATFEPTPVEGVEVRAKSRSKATKSSKAKKSAKTKGNSKGKGTSEKKAAKAAPKRVRNYKFHAKKELSAAFPAIVDELVSRAKKGSLTHTRLLFDIGGVKDKPVHRESQPAVFSLAELLLDEAAKNHEHASDAVKTDTNASEQQAAQEPRA